MKKTNKINTLLKASILAIILIFTSCANLSIASNQVSSSEKAANYVIEQRSIDKDEVLIYVWGLVDEGEEVFSTKEHVMDTPQKGYIIYIDSLPRANLFHPVEYVFISENKEQLIVKDAMSLPLNFDDYQMIDTEIGAYMMSLENRRAVIPENSVKSPSKG